MPRPVLAPDRLARLAAIWPDPAVETRDICREFGLSQSRLRRYARQLGLPRRPTTPAVRAQLRVNGRHFVQRARRADDERALDQVARCDRYLAQERGRERVRATMYACPGCGCRAASPQGHAGCQREDAAA
jgi:transposase-like protein